MESGEKLTLQMPFEGPRRPILMQQIVGTAKQPETRMLYLMALEEGDDRGKFKDPFKARDSKTGKIVKLKKSRERLTAYNLMQIQPPKDLIERVEIQNIIRARKSSKIVKRGIKNVR